MPRFPTFVRVAFRGGRFVCLVAINVLAAAVAILLPSQIATAQYSSGFETVTASAAGTILTGQDAYYIPAATTSVDFNAFTYAGNTLGVPPNPNGGKIFIAGTGPAGGAFARAQRDITYSTGPWTLGFDVLATFTGTLPSAQNLGSFSVQPFPGSQSFIALATWSDPNTGTNWNADYVWFDAAGTQLTEQVADPGFQNLDVNKWYRWETDVDFGTNQIVEVRIKDIVGGTTTTHNPVDRYMLGGMAGSAAPTGFRFFAGGGVAGNTLAFDNPGIDQTAECWLVYGLNPDRFVLGNDTLLVQPLGMIEMTLTNLPVISVPRHPGLIGASLYLQSFMYNPVVYPQDPVMLSQGLRYTIGVSTTAYGQGSGLNMWPIGTIIARPGGRITIDFALP